MSNIFKVNNKGNRKTSGTSTVNFNIFHTLLLLMLNSIR